MLLLYLCPVYLAEVAYLLGEIVASGMVLCSSHWLWVWDHGGTSQGHSQMLLQGWGKLWFPNPVYGLLWLVCCGPDGDCAFQPSWLVTAGHACHWLRGKQSCCPSQCQELLSRQNQTHRQNYIWTMIPIYLPPYNKASRTKALTAKGKGLMKPQELKK